MFDTDNDTDSMITCTDSQASDTQAADSENSDSQKSSSQITDVLKNLQFLNDDLYSALNALLNSTPAVQLLAHPDWNECFRTISRRMKKTYHEIENLMDDITTAKDEQIGEARDKDDEIVYLKTVKKGEC